MPAVLHPEADPDAWGVEALRQQLAPLLPGLEVDVLAHTDSTNTRLLERARNASPAVAAPCLLVAQTQTQGRGRQGRTWMSAPGASLTFSLALPLAPLDWSGLSLAVGLALADALEPPDALGPQAAPRIALKWPNDLWLREGPGRGRKLGGILIETVSLPAASTAPAPRWCVVGVGLNVLPLPLPAQAGVAQPGLAHGYACLQEINPAATAPAVLAQVALPLVQALRRFEAQGYAPLVETYARRDLLLGQQVRTTQPGNDGSCVEGLAEGVDERGALRVRSGILHHVVAGEVSVRLQA